MQPGASQCPTGLECGYGHWRTPTPRPKIDGTETQVRRPRAGRPGRRTFVSGKRRQNTTAPPKKPKNEACDGDKRAWHEARRRQSSARICVEHTNAELRQWAPLQRFTGRREIYEETHVAIAGLASDRSAQRPTRHRTSTALIRVRNGAS